MIGQAERNKERMRGKEQGKERKKYWAIFKCGKGLYEFWGFNTGFFVFIFNYIIEYTAYKILKNAILNKIKNEKTKLSMKLKEHFDDLSRDVWNCQLWNWP